MTRDDVLTEFGSVWPTSPEEAMADEISRLRAILAALREPSEAVLKAAATAIRIASNPLTQQEAICAIITTAVAAAEREVSHCDGLREIGRNNSKYFTRSDVAAAKREVQP